MQVLGQPWLYRETLSLETESSNNKTKHYFCVTRHVTHKVNTTTYFGKSHVPTNKHCLFPSAGPGLADAGVFQPLISKTNDLSLVQAQTEQVVSGLPG